MNRTATFILTAAALLCLAVTLPPGDATAQQKQGLLQIEWVIFVILRAIPVFDGDAIAD